MTREVNLDRTNRMINLIRREFSEKDIWVNDTPEKSPINAKSVRETKGHMELIQLSNELRGRLVNLYA
ncbi:MAG: hypothetical protein V2A56_09145 [bacterium]